jgi:hypothetical protein
VRASVQDGEEAGMSQKYKQCQLAKGSLEAGNMIQQIAWIPSQFAVMNAVLKIAGDDGWVVVWAGRDEVDDSHIAPYSYGQIKKRIEKR